MVFCPRILSLLCFVYKFIMFFHSYNYNIFYPLWNQYTDSIVNPLAYVTGWCCACYFVRFDLSVNNLSHFVSTLCSLDLSIIPLVGMVLL